MCGDRCLTHPATWCSAGPHDAARATTSPVTWFSSRNISSSTVPAPSEAIWAVLTDPALLASLTPLVSSIEGDGDHWTWTLAGIDGLGLTVAPSFTERMEFIDERSIVFTHEPPPRSRERAAVDGVYELTPAADAATDLAIDLTLSVDLPLPRLARPAVEEIMRTTMRTTGHRFATNLYRHLGLDPRTVTVDEARP